MLPIKPTSAALPHPASLGGGLLALGALQLPQLDSWSVAVVFLLNVCALWWIFHHGLALLRRRWPRVLSEFAQQPQHDWWPCFLLLPILAAWWLVADSPTLPGDKTLQPFLLQVVLVSLGASFLLHALVQWPEDDGPIQRSCDRLHLAGGGLSAALLVLAIMAHLHSTDMTPPPPAFKPASYLASTGTDCESSEDDEGTPPCVLTSAQQQSTATNSEPAVPANLQQPPITLLNLLSDQLTDTALPYDASSFAIALVSLLKLLGRFYLASVNGQTHPSNGTQLLSSLLQPNRQPTAAEPAPTTPTQQSPSAFAQTVAAAVTLLDAALHQPAPSEAAASPPTQPDAPSNGQYKEVQPVAAPQATAISGNLTAANQKTLQQLHHLLTQPGALPTEMQQHQRLLQQLVLLAEKS